MKLIHEGGIPELDEIERLPLMRVLLNHEHRDEGISLRFRGIPFGRGDDHEFRAPRVLGAYHNRQGHADKGLHAYILFSDSQIADAIKDYEARVEAAVKEKLLRGVFCLDLTNSIVGYNPNLSDIEGRDAYRLNLNVMGMFAMDRTSIDILNEALAMNFDLKLFEPAHGELRFTETISKESIWKYR